MWQARSWKSQSTFAAFYPLLLATISQDLTKELCSNVSKLLLFQNGMVKQNNSNSPLPGDPYFFKIRASVLDEKP